MSDPLTVKRQVETGQAWTFKEILDTLRPFVSIRVKAETSGPLHDGYPVIALMRELRAAEVLYIKLGGKMEDVEPRKENTGAER